MEVSSNAAALEAAQARLDEVRDTGQKLRAAIGQVVIGQEPVVEQVLWSLLAGGHVLLEGAPGLGKTLLVHTLSQCLSLSFGRIQFTPDLMPGDITGSNVLLLNESGTSAGQFRLQKGPVFNQLLLADEINRATPKTQSALLEAMQEHAVTISGTRHRLPAPFMVLATENPIEMEGTYPLPEAQLDRFLLKVYVPRPEEDTLQQILRQTTAQPTDGPDPLLDEEQILDLQRLCRDVVIATPMLAYAAALVTASDPSSGKAPDIVRQAVRYGAGVRAAQSMILAAKARALLEGRAHLDFQDLKAAAAPALRHRIVLTFAGEAEGITTDNVIEQLLKIVPETSQHAETSA